MKHALLIIAHNNLEILIKIVELLNCPQIDFYIHIDKKCNINYSDIKQKINSNNIYFFKEIDANWGDFSLVQIELLLLEEALKRKYDYYHLISGVDFPLKNVEQFLSFFEINNSVEFVHFYSQCIPKSIEKRYKYYHLFEKVNWKRKKFGKYIYIFLDKIFELPQHLFINRSHNQFKYQYGSQWFSITDELCSYIINNKQFIQKNFSHTNCPDESFLQTIIINNEYFYNRLFDKSLNDDYHQNMRCIDWKKGNPYTFKLEDYNLLINSDKLFARKFDYNIDSNIINKLYEKGK